MIASFSIVPHSSSRRLKEFRILASLSSKVCIFLEIAIVCQFKMSYETLRFWGLSNAVAIQLLVQVRLSVNILNKQVLNASQPQGSAIHYLQKLFEIYLPTLILVNLSLDQLHFIISWI